MNGSVVHTVRCDGEMERLGLDETRPVFDWCCEVDPEQWRIVMTDEEGDPGRCEGVVWDSGWRHEPGAVRALYEGPRLQSCNRYRFAVSVRAADGAEYEGEPTWFETAFMDDEPWPGQWICAPDARTEPAPIFLSSVCVDKRVARARAYVTGLGYYEFRINGQKTGTAVLEPAWTDYRKRIQYETYDIEPYLREGANSVAIMVGTGRYRRPIANVVLRIVFQDGEVRLLATGTTPWFWAKASPIIAQNLYDGEHYDARIVVEGWDTPKPPVDLASYPRALLAEPPGGRLEARTLEPIRVIADIEPVSVTTPEVAPGVLVYDLGQNISGWARLRVKGEAGTVVILKFSEALRDDGLVEMRMNRGAEATDRYVLRGDPDGETWEPRFTYHGFRYVQVEYGQGRPHEFSLVGRFVRSAVAEIGTFRCANELANRIDRACAWTEADNLHSVPTDCPQRDERLGWLNDMTVRCEAAPYRFDLARLYAKWTQDIADAQGEVTGAIPDVAPFEPYHTPPFGHRPADPVSSSYLLVPWTIYLHTGDPRPLSRAFRGLVRWYDYLLAQSVEGILEWSYYGDWASPQRFCDPASIGAGAYSAVTPGALVSTAFLCFDAQLLARISRALGYSDEAGRFTREAEEIAQTFNRRFFDPEAGCYASGSQAAQVLPLRLGIVPEQWKPGVVHWLVRDIVEVQGGHLSTGNLCTKYLPEVLCEHGYVDLAWELATQTSYPSWGYMIEHGATTIWERWEYIRGGEMASHNHPMYATIGRWFMRYLGGIRPTEDAPGFRRVELRPYLPRTLEWVESALRTVRGTVGSSWKRIGDGAVEYRFLIPPSAEGRAILPAGVVRGDGEVVGMEQAADGERVVVRLPSGRSTIVVETPPGDR